MALNTKNASPTWQLLGRIYTYIRPYKFPFWISVGLAIWLALISPVRGILIQYTLDLGLHQPTRQLPNWFISPITALAKNRLADLIIFLTIFQIAFSLFESGLKFLFSYITAWLGQYIVNDLRIEIFNKIIHLNLRQFDHTPIGTLTTRTVNDIESINEIFSDGLISIVADLLTILVITITMFWMNWKLTLICLSAFPIMLIATYVFKEAVKKSFVQVRNAVSNLNAFVQEHLSGMQVVQAFNAEAIEMKKFAQINAEHRNANIRAIFAYSVFFPVVEVVLAISLGLLVWWVAHKQIEAGTLVAFILFLNQMFRPLRVLADKFNVLQMGVIAGERVFKVLDNPDLTENNGNRPSVRSNETDAIQFKNVWFAYNQDDWVLKNISFSLSKGETLALVGSTGSGKTSIISLINRLYQPQQGEILLEGQNILDLDLQKLRSQIGIILQDVFLFNGTLYDNLTLGNSSIAPQEVEKICSLVGLHKFIEQLPGKYDFNILERGAALSAGQKQLISFARCLLYNPAIIIMDEATSNIDPETEQLIQQAIELLMANRTAIVIAHRLSTIRKAHKIIVMDKGELVEMGTQTELLSKNGRYAKLHYMQFQQ